MEKLADNGIIQEATEAVTKGYPCAFYVPQLLEVIKSKEAEIFNLNKEISALKLKNDEFLKSNEKAKAEIERRKAEKVKLHTLIPKMLVEAKSEAYREFALDLKCGVPQETGVIRCADVDNTLNELTRNLHGTCTETTDQTATNHSVSLIDGHIEG